MTEILISQRTHINSKILQKWTKWGISKILSQFALKKFINSKIFLLYFCQNKFIKWAYMQNKYVYLENKLSVFQKCVLRIFTLDTFFTYWRLTKLKLRKMYILITVTLSKVVRYELWHLLLLWSTFCRHTNKLTYFLFLPMQQTVYTPSVCY